MNAWTGTRRLIRLVFRRDRVILTVWAVAICGLIAGVIWAETALYRDPLQRAAGAAMGASNVMARVFDGPASGTSLGAMSLVEGYQILAILIALMSAQAVIRHTRLDEETGRAELIGSSVVGRHARLTAALVAVALADAVISLAMIAVLVGFGLPFGGSVAAGMSLFGVGFAFACVAAVAAQVSTTQRGANGIVTLSIGVAFLLRAIGDAFGTVAPSGVELISRWPSWLSPLGWGQQVRPFHQDNWEVGLLFAAFSAVLIGLAYRLSDRRDLGAGMLVDRLGPASAESWLLSPWGLAWRLQRSSLLAWVLGMAVAGAAFGAVGTSVDDFADISPQFVAALEALFPGKAYVDIYAAFLMSFLGVAAAGFAVQALLRMRAEEEMGRLEPVLATSVDRRVWFASHGVLAGVGSVAVVATMGFSATVGYGIATGDFATGLGQAEAALAQLPAVLALGAFVMAAFALVPRWAPVIAWGALAASLVVGQLGELLKLPQVALNLSPFTHVPGVPAEPFDALPLVVLSVVATALVALAMVAFRRRSLAIPA